MPQPTRPTGQTSTAPNPAALTSAGESSSQAYGRTRSASGSQARDERMSIETSEVMEHAKETISDVASQATGKVTQQLDSQRDRAASSLGTVAQALRQTSDQIREENDNTGLPVHQYVASAADQVERFSGYLRSTDVRQMIGDVEHFARRQPGLFLGGAFLLGLIGARFLKSSGESAMTRNRSSSEPREFAGRDDYSHRGPYDSSPRQAGYPDEYGESDTRQAHESPTPQTSTSFPTNPPRGRTGDI